MKKRLALLIPIYIIIVYMFSGCSGSYNYEGKEYIDKAAQIHTAYESAMVTLYDNATGAIVQSIEYRFEGDVMQYMYYANADGKQYYEFNNGTEINRLTLPDESKWTGIAKGSEEFYSYSRVSRHYFADGAQLFTDYEAAVSESTVEDTGEQIVVTLSYDLNKLGQYAALSAYGEFTDFKVTFMIDKELGSCTQFTNEYTLADGTKGSYTVYTFKRNPDFPIARTEADI